MRLTREFVGTLLLLSACLCSYAQTDPVGASGAVGVPASPTGPQATRPKAVSRAAGPVAAPAVPNPKLSPVQKRFAEVDGWTHSCREYVETSAQCKVRIDMSPTSPMPSAPGHVPFQYDVTVGNTEQAAIVLRHASPFVKCALTTTPSLSARDLSTSLTTAMTSIAGAGLFAENPLIPALLAPISSPAPMLDLDAIKVDATTAFRAENASPSNPAPQPPTPPPALEAQLKEFTDRLESERGVLRPISRDIQRIITITKRLNYAYDSEDSFEDAAKTLYDAASSLLQDSLPDAAHITTATHNFKTLADDVNAWKDTNAASLSNYPTLSAQFQEVEEKVTALRFLVDHLNDAERFIADEQKVVEPLFDLLVQLSDPTVLGTFNQGPYLGQVLEINNAPQRKSLQTITCKDAVTAAQAFDTITFTVYFGRNPQFDVSAGVLVSLLKGHQVGTVSGPVMTVTNPDGSTTQTAPTELQVTNSSRVQFMPATFFEYHPWNFKLPLVKDQPKPSSRPPHPLGYVGTFGFAEGLALNPNNGSATAELFTGLSLGIQRFAIIAGNHFGRYQDFTGGYAVGDTVPSGTNPPTNRRWTNHPAFGFVYRVPIR